ncbi:BnaA06g37460D [Brassica napus]|uniref:BnaA06g37460D protein n=2 Tax=Brassica TaxID=3705 RepID=A0A078JKC6_BRANA|nr:BnaA06g37460D [Brassica napus]
MALARLALRNLQQKLSSTFMCPSG